MIIKRLHLLTVLVACCLTALEAGGARRLWNESFFSAPQLKRDSLGSAVTETSNFVEGREDARSKCPSDASSREQSAILASRVGYQHRRGRSSYVFESVLPWPRAPGESRPVRNSRVVFRSLRTSAVVGRCTAAVPRGRAVRVGLVCSRAGWDPGWPLRLRPGAAPLLASLETAPPSGCTRRELARGEVPRPSPGRRSLTRA